MSPAAGVRVKVLRLRIYANEILVLIICPKLRINSCSTRIGWALVLRRNYCRMSKPKFSTLMEHGDQLNVMSSKN
jgi:hypothetical protein